MVKRHTRLASPLITTRNLTLDILSVGIALIAGFIGRFSASSRSYPSLTNRISRRSCEPRGHGHISILADPFTGKFVPTGARLSHYVRKHRAVSRVMATEGLCYHLFSTILSSLLVSPFPLTSHATRHIHCVTGYQY